MPRPSKVKTIGKKPKHVHFKGDNENLKIELTLEEYETIRLIDYMGCSQSDCAKQMNTARTTVVALYNNARKKIARFLLEGCVLDIQGGHYVVNESKGVMNMKIAVTCVNGEVFGHFGHCPSFLVCEVENGVIVSKDMLYANGGGCSLLVDLLKDNNVDVVICGGIGGGAKNHIVAKGMKVLPGASGDALAQVESYIAGTLSYDPDSECNHHSHDEGHNCHSQHKCH